MEKLSLKKEYEGMIITRKILSLGEVSFNANDVHESNYENFAQIGFSDLFEEVKEKAKDSDSIDSVIKEVEDYTKEDKIKKKK